MPVYTRKHGLAEILATGLAPLRLGPGEGNFSISNLMENQTQEVDIMDRGEHLELAEGDQVYSTFTITVYRDGPQHSASNLTIMDTVLKRSGSAAAGGTTSDEGGVVWTAPVRFTELRGGSITQTTLPNCRMKIDSIGEAASGNTMTISGTSYGRPTYA